MMFPIGKRERLLQKGDKPKVFHRPKAVGRHNIIYKK